jgi:hypothetical protein
VHVRNLSTLGGVNGIGDGKGKVELFERGYGKDAAGIAREAINYGKSIPCACFIVNDGNAPQPKKMILTLF